MLDKWGYERRISIDFSRPETSTDNVTVGSFNGKLRLECLNENWFMSLEDTRCNIEVWRIHYNQKHIHSVLGWMTRPNLLKSLPIARTRNQHEADYS